MSKPLPCYIEGIADGREFMETAGEVTKIKPVIALKAGRSQAGSKAAMSHTGSLAGSYATYKAMFTQVGVNPGQYPHGTHERFRRRHRTAGASIEPDRHP